MSENENIPIAPISNTPPASLPPTPPNLLLTGNPHKSLGPILGIIIVIFILLIGGFYFWGRLLVQKDTPTDKIPVHHAPAQNEEALIPSIIKI